MKYLMMTTAAIAIGFSSFAMANGSQNAPRNPMPSPNAVLGFGTEMLKLQNGQEYQRGLNDGFQNGLNEGFLGTFEQLTGELPGPTGGSSNPFSGGGGGELNLTPSLQDLGSDSYR